MLLATLAGRAGGDAALTTAGLVGNAHDQRTFAVGMRAVPVTVLDKAGQPLLGLTSANFEVSDDGQRQAVTLFSAERHPLRIALALDYAGD